MNITAYTPVALFSLSISSNTARPTKQQKVSHCNIDDVSIPSDNTNAFDASASSTSNSAPTSYDSSITRGRFQLVTFGSSQVAEYRCNDPPLCGVSRISKRFVEQRYPVLIHDLVKNMVRLRLKTDPSSHHGATTTLSVADSDDTFLVFEDDDTVCNISETTEKRLDCDGQLNSPANHCFLVNHGTKEAWSNMDLVPPIGDKNLVFEDRNENDNDDENNVLTIS
jgi:hypothetical protein